MDEETRRYYEARAGEIGRAFESIESPMRRYFAAAFPAGGRILDVGAGTGREMAALVGEGYEAWGVEPVRAFRDVAIVEHPELASRLRGGALPDGMPDAEEIGGQFDGVLCSAVLQHVPRNRLFDAVYALRALLVEGGRALISVPAERPGIDDERDAGGRLFTGIVASELELLFERLGFVRVGRWSGDDALGRVDHSWTTLCLELRSSGDSRPLDHLESVLSTRERKVATYKLALIRALCAIALTAPHSASYGSDGLVRVPLTAIAERWIDYYWPLFESQTFLPQKHGEESARTHGLRFARELVHLQDLYAGAGGQSAFDLDRRSNRLSPPARRAHRALLAKLRTTIREGPVKYAGGSLDERMFAHKRGQVHVAGPIWRELSLTGHWVQDALLLRWAKLVSRLSHGRVAPGDVLSHLLHDPRPERDTRVARIAYEKEPRIECVWTGSVVRRDQLAIDHVLPYSLWRNNDLWNLLPTRATVNASKRDDLPTRGLLRSRREAIIDCWELTHDAYPERFEGEARVQLGGTYIDLGSLFDVLVESVEITALQRACRRWEP